MDFDRVADVYDNVGVPWFTPIARQLVRFAAPQPGERALDAGCGRGAATLALADAVGPEGRVTAIDLSPGMVAACRAEVAGRSNVDIQVMDAAAPTGSYDLIVSSLVVFFLSDPLAALRAWRDLLTGPAGRVAISTFGPQDAVWTAVDAVFRPYLPRVMLDARVSGASGPFASDAGVESLLTAAGYHGVRTENFDVEVTLADADEWYLFTRSHGQLAMWDAVPPADHDMVRSTAARLLDGARGPDGRIHLNQQVRVTLGAVTP